MCANLFMVFLFVWVLLCVLFDSVAYKTSRAKAAENRREEFFFAALCILCASAFGFFWNDSLTDRQRPRVGDPAGGAGHDFQHAVAEPRGGGRAGRHAGDFAV